MKLTVLLLLCSMSVFAQHYDPAITILSTKLDTISFKVDYTSHCLNKFRKEQQLGYGLMLGGAIVTFLATNEYVNGYKKAYADIPYYGYYDNNGVWKNIELSRTNQDKLNSITTIRNIGTYTGSAAILSGIVLQFISYRHLKRAYIIPERNGLTVGFKF